MARNISIGQDPLGQALDIFQQSFHGALGRVIEQRGIIERENIRAQDMRAVEAMDSLINQMNTANPEAGSKIINQFRQVSEAGSPRLNVLGKIVGSYLKDSLENKKEASLKIASFSNTLDELGKAIKKGDQAGFDNAKAIVLSIEKNQLDELADISDKVYKPAIASALDRFAELETLRKLKVGLRGFDTNLSTPEIDFDENIGEYTQARVKSAERLSAEHPQKALDILLTGVPISEQQDVTAEKAIKKAIDAETRRVETEEIKERRLINKIERREWNSELENKIDNFNSILQETDIKEADVQPFTAGIKFTAEGDIKNVEEIKSQSADTIYQLHKKMSDAEIPKDADLLFDQIDVAIGIGEKEVIDLAKQELADWWMNNSSEIGTLDPRKTFEFISGSEKENRIQSMINMIDIYKMTKEGAPKMDILFTKEELNLSPTMRSIIDASLIEE